jgi:hypothetical protein
MLRYREHWGKNWSAEMAFYLIELNGRGGVSLPSSLVRQEIQLAFYA